jgi:hypothetical protein
MSSLNLAEQMEHIYRDLFEAFFNIDELSTVEVAGRRGSHMAIRSLLTTPTPGLHRPPGNPPAPRACR